MLTVPVNNAQNDGDKNERKPSDKANGDDCGYGRKPIRNASAKVVWEIAVNT